MFFEINTGNIAQFLVKVGKRLKSHFQSSLKFFATCIKFTSLNIGQVYRE